MKTLQTYLVIVISCFIVLGGTGCTSLSLFSTDKDVHYNDTDKLEKKIEKLEKRMDELEEEVEQKPGSN